MKKTLFTLFAAVAFVCSMTLISCGNSGKSGNSDNSELSLVDDFETTVNDLVKAYSNGDEAKIQSLEEHLKELDDKLDAADEDALTDEEWAKLEKLVKKYFSAKYDYDDSVGGSNWELDGEESDLDEDDWELDGEESDLDEEDAEETGLEGLGAQAKDAVKAAQEKAEDMVKAAQDKAEDMVKAAQEKAETAVNDAVNKAAQELENLFK